MISVYLDKHNRMPLDTKDYFAKQISNLSKGVVIVASAMSISFCFVTQNPRENGNTSKHTQTRYKQK